MTNTEAVGAKVEIERIERSSVEISRVEQTDAVKAAKERRNALAAEATELARQAHAARGAGDEAGAKGLFVKVRELHRREDLAHEDVRAARIAQS